jgi:hypothetical protein
MLPGPPTVTIECLPEGHHAKAEAKGVAVRLLLKSTTYLSCKGPCLDGGCLMLFEYVGIVSA